MYPSSSYEHVTHAGFLVRYIYLIVNCLQTSNAADTGRRLVFGKTRFINPPPQLPKIKETGWVLVSLVSRVSARLQVGW